MILPIRLGDRSYDVVIERGGLSRVGELFDLDRRVFILTDSGVPRQYAEAVAKAAKEPTVFTVPAGEESKSMAQFSAALSAMFHAGLSRKDCVVAVGGGVCGDLAGFAAATYMRGVDFYNVPTTLLSQVDSSIGGKTAIDFEGVKNIVGAFYQPKKVLIDPETLSTLDRRQLVAGLCEAIKMAATSDAELFRLIETQPFEEHLDEIIEGALRIKRGVVEQDEKESGLRKILNFGHTVGHGIEATDTPTLYHGECVSLGMLPMCAGETREKLTHVLQKVGLPTTCRLQIDDVMNAIAHDKKKAEAGIDCVLVPEIGKAEIVRLSPDALRARVEACFSK